MLAMSIFVFVQSANAGQQPEPPPFYQGVCCHGPNNAACFPATDVLEECYNAGLGYIIYAQCTPNPCPGAGIGACCYGFGDCLAEVDPAGCVNFGGTFAGAGSTCNTNPCNIGACCFATAPCQVMHETNCTAAGGVTVPVSECVVGPEFNTCIGACCANLTACTNQTAYNCIAVMGQTFVAFGDCNGPFQECTFAAGACCYFEGCEIGNSFCGKGAGVFYGVGSTCEDVDCTKRACCFPNGSCAMMDETECMQAAGVFNGGRTCPLQPCGVNACCIGTTCTQATHASCVNAGGFHYGETPQACTPQLCGIPLCPCQGDVNGDGLRNGRDIKSFVDCAIQAGSGGPVPTGCDCADITEDSLLDSNDVFGMVLMLLGGGC